jgi:hypothetical protein
MKIILINTETNCQETWKLKDLISWLNTDRNEEWKPYTNKDWKQGLEHFGYPYRIAKTERNKSAVKISCENYLGNRGICEPVKRCAYFDGIWFIIFDNCPQDVEVSFECGIYECYTDYPAKGFKWNKDNYQAIKNNLEKI